MGRIMAKSTSSHISILVGSESESNSEETLEDTESDFEDRSFGLNESTREEDVVPTYILKPKEILKNIDLMKTVAMLMEGKLRQPLHKCPDHEKLRDLYSDVHRFPEAFQKFTSIVHQIQYLNVTTDWEHNSSDINASSIPMEEECGNFFTKVFGTSFSRRETTQDYRKKIMLNLLNDTHKVFIRYQAIQAMLEERLNKYNKLILKKSYPHQNGSEGGGGMETEEDDPQAPLLSTKGQTYHQHQKNYDRAMQKFDMMEETLRKTLRSATDVQDSIDVLRDLIRWDYKQAVTTTKVSPSRNQSYGSTDSPSGLEASYQQTNQCEADIEASHANSLTLLPEVEIRRSSCHQSTQVSSTLNGTNRRLLIILALLISVILVLSIITAALSLLKFGY